MRVMLFRDLPSEGWPSMERYADELAAGLQRLGCEVCSFVPPRPLPRLRGRIGALLNYIWRSTAYPIGARRHSGSVNHVIDHSYAHLIQALDPRRTVVTCHDLAPLALNQLGLSRRLWDRSFRAMLRAGRIIADSAHTRDEILRRAGYPADRIHVVPLGVAATFFEALPEANRRALRERHGLAGRLIVLHVGSCQPRKNVESMLRALVGLRDLDVVFVQVGGQFSADQHKLINELNLRAVQIPTATESELRAWYQDAAVLMLPSLYEGFGLPVLEAMASGTPVVCAGATALTEVADDAAVLIDPHNPATLSAAIRSVLTQPELAASLRQRGLQRARLFTWERCARETLAVYRRLIDSVQ